MRNTVIKVDQVLIDALQARQVELEGYKNLWNFAISNPPYPVPAEKVAELENKVVSLTGEYELLKSQVEAQYLPKEYNRAKTSWNLDFSSGEMAVVEND